MQVGVDKEFVVFLMTQNEQNFLTAGLMSHINGYIFGARRKSRRIKEQKRRNAKERRAWKSQSLTLS